MSMPEDVLTLVNTKFPSFLNKTFLSAGVSVIGNSR